MRSSASILLFASLALFAGEVRAHILLTSPQPRTESQKQGPCGAGAADPRGPTVATFMPGETITVTWNEFINHPGHFRISLDEDGQDDFFEPKGFDDVSGGPGVLIDGIAHEDDGEYSVQVELPDVECDNCVLQIIQMMSDKPPYGDGNDLYYQCSDIAIVGNEGSTSGETSTTGGSATTGEPGSTAGESDEGGGTAKPDTSASESGSATTGEQPTTGAAGSSTGAATGGSVTDGTGDATTDGGDKDSGCGCRSSDAGGLGWLTAGLLLPLLRRRRR
ncbi:MAG: lytic polysaccharide monooxygenase [Nannocystis sp.]|nr:SCE4755 family polysaccharide monooxygenase-like protein [Nannocystis sp.]MBA3549802.1 lytic polysaccharide monooxygenase [Nannocystis sp.]